MNSRFMMSVAAAALIAGSGFAFAQGAGGAVRAVQVAALPGEEVLPPPSKTLRRRVAR